MMVMLCECNNTECENYIKGHCALSLFGCKKKKLKNSRRNKWVKN